MAVKSRVYYEDFADYEESSKQHLKSDTRAYLEACNHRLKF